MAGGTGGAEKRAPCHQARVCKSQVATVLLLGFRDGQGGLSAENNSFWRGWGLWREVVGGSLDRTKNLPEQSHCIWTEQSSRPLFSGCPVLAPPPELHTPPPHREGGMEGGRAAPHVGMHIFRICRCIHGLHGHCFPCQPCPQAGILTPSLVLPQGAQAGTHTLIFMLYVTRPHTTISQGKQSAKVSLTIMFRFLPH